MGDDHFTKKFSPLTLESVWYKPCSQESRQHSLTPHQTLLLPPPVSVPLALGNKLMRSHIPSILLARSPIFVNLLSLTCLFSCFSLNEATNLKASNPAKVETKISKAPVCSPGTERSEAGIVVDYPQCPKEYYDQQATGAKLTEDFIIPEGDLARRVRFWQRVFTEWTNNDFVINSELYPEIVLAIGKPRIAYKSHKPRAARKVSRHMYRKIRHFKRILYRMNRKSPTSFTPEEKRIEAIMAHIKDPHKYRIAARSLRLQNGNQDSFVAGLARSAKFLPHIKKAFKEVGVPEELSYIAFIESSFNPKAISKVGASGAYQIMPGTGKDFLRIYGGIDERRDPIKSGRAAAKVFKQSYKVTGTWPLAVTGYNHGPYGLKKASKRLGTTDLESIIRRNKARTFGYASKNFYVEFLAIVDVMQNLPNFVSEPPIFAPLDFYNLRMTKKRRISWILRNHKISKSDFAALNPDVSWRILRRNGFLPRGFVIKLASLKDQKTAMN